MAEKQRWVLANRIAGMPAPTDFRLEAYDPGMPAEGELLVRTCFHTVAPGIRPKLSGRTYTGAVEIGDTIPGVGVAVVESSGDPHFSQGDLVTGETGWASHRLLKSSAVEKLDTHIFDGGVPHTAAISAIGPAGLTAYFGLLKIVELRGCETVIVSSASGAVGSLAAQIAKLKGCRVVGIAGSDEKCRRLVSDFRLDVAINYRSEADLVSALERACPGGAQVYFDNVGGEVTTAAIAALSDFGRVIVCGQTSEYNRTEPYGLKSLVPVIVKRLTLFGLVVYDFADQFREARREIAQWIREGQIRHAPTVIDGLENAVDVFVSLFAGSGDSQPIIRVSAV